MCVCNRVHRFYRNKTYSDGFKVMTSESVDSTIVHNDIHKTAKKGYLARLIDAFKSHDTKHLLKIPG